MGVNGLLKFVRVAPHAGAWIETLPAMPVSSCGSSHPTRVRGLKQHHRDFVFDVDTGRTPRGCVD